MKNSSSIWKYSSCANILNAAAKMYDTHNQIEEAHARIYWTFSEYSLNKRKAKKSKQKKH